MNSCGVKRAGFILISSLNGIIQSPKKYLDITIVKDIPTAIPRKNKAPYQCSIKPRNIAIQLDDFQYQELDIGFDPLDVPRDQFIVGGKAWLYCRNGEADPDSFGIFDLRGLWFVRGNLIRDIAALNKVELLPWDGWGLIDCKDESISHEELTLLDNISSMTSDEVDFFSVRNAYETNEGLLVPPIIKSYTQSGSIEIDLSTEEVVD